MPHCLLGKLGAQLLQYEAYLDNEVVAILGTFTKINSFGRVQVENISKDVGLSHIKSDPGVTLTALFEKKTDSFKRHHYTVKLGVTSKSSPDLSPQNRESTQIR